MRRILRISLVIIIATMMGSVAFAGVDVSLEVEPGAGGPAEMRGAPGTELDSRSLPLTGADALRLFTVSLTLIAIGSIFLRALRRADERSRT